MLLELNNLILQKKQGITLIMKKWVNINPIAEIDLCEYNLNIGMLVNANSKTCSHKMNKKQTATTELE